MNDAVDYALSQGQDLGVALWFLVLNLAWIIPTLLILIFVGYWAFKLMRYLYKKNKLFVVLPIVIVMTLFLSICMKGQTFRKDRERNVPITLSSDLKSRIIKECSHKSKQEIIEYSLDTTAKLLEFSVKNEKLGDNKVSKANCVGYAALCKAISNYAFAINNYPTRSKQVVGHLFVGPINICKLVSSLGTERFSNFTKDHDVIEIDGKFYDPSLYDYHITLKN